MAINRGDLVKRVAVGAVYVFITSVCTLLSWHTTVIVIALTAGLCCYEFLRMARNAGHRPYIVIGTGTAVLIPLACCLLINTDHVVAGGLAVAFIAGVVMLLRFFMHESDTIVDLSLTLFGYLYTGLVFSSFLLVRGYLPGIEGGLLGFMVLASVWVNDGFAYLGGSAFGRHKFSPRISPNKTWEGVICGLVGSVIAWLLVPAIVPACGFSAPWAVLTGIIVGIAAIIGDLTESHIKRGFNAKDSGDIMPGHGGMLDRSDSLIIASCAAYAMIAVHPYVMAALGGLAL